MPKIYDEKTSSYIELTQEHQAAIVSLLLADRCSNYGYDWRAFRRISNQRSRARKAVRYSHVRELNWGASFLSRVQICARTGQVHYVVGQSANEEITNALRQLKNPSAKWVS